MSSPTLSQSSPMTVVNASCACHSFTLSATIPTSLLPLPTTLCLCSTCRLTSGTTGGISHINLSLATSTIPALSTDTSLSSLKSYTTSKSQTRWFCNMCGAHCLVCVTEEGRTWWLLSTGLLERGEDVVKWDGVKFVEDTRDGGVGIWLRSINDGKEDEVEKRVLKAWKGDEEEEVEIDGNLTSVESAGDDDTHKKDILRASCHCKGIQFHVTRPTPQSLTAYSPFPDLMIPYNSKISASNPSHTPWFIRNNTKYLAGTCTCPSCRQNLGFEVQTWAFVPKCNIFLSRTGKELDYEDMRKETGGGLRRYESSEGVHREFCGDCGATVFWHCDVRPGVVDVSTGLLEGSNGVRCEDWLEWCTDRVSFREMATSKRLVNALEDGMRVWGGRRKMRK